MAAVGAIITAGCGGSADSSSEDASGGGGLKGETIAVAFDVDGPPFAYVEGGSEPVGFDVDIIEEVAQRSGFELKKISLPFDGVLPALQAKQVEIAAAAISITDEREQVVLFSTPYYQTGITLATTPANTEIQTIDDLKGRSVAVRTGSSNSLYVEALAFADDIEIHRYNSTNDQLQAVLSGVDDAAVNDGSILDYYIAQKGKGKLEVRGPLLNTDNYGYAVSKDRKDLKKAIDDALIAMASDGTYAKIYQKYFAKEPAALPGDIG
jgi:ABC-type amino acid transport substrate-binding protein